MPNDFLYDHISDYDLFFLKDYGVFHLSVTQASKVIAKILCLQGDIEDELPEIPDDENYSLYDSSLDAPLSKSIEKYKKIILLGVEKGTLKAERLLRNPDESVNPDETYLEMETLADWLADRSIEIRGDWYEQYVSDEQKVAEVAVRAIGIKRYNLLNRKNKKEELTPEEQNSILRIKLEELEKEKAEAWINSYSYDRKIEKIPPKPLHTKEKETLLKLVIGMAKDAYGYDPLASRSPVPKEISDILAQRGMPLDPDTVRRWLKEAGKFLPEAPRNPDD